MLKCFWRKFEHSLLNESWLLAYDGRGGGGGGGGVKTIPFSTLLNALWFISKLLSEEHFGKMFVATNVSHTKLN